jgi:hypothetical protein
MRSLWVGVKQNTLSSNLATTTSYNKVPILNAVIETYRYDLLNTYVFKNFRGIKEYWYKICYKGRPYRTLGLMPPSDRWTEVENNTLDVLDWRGTL